MSGFPELSGRSTYGPTLEDESPVRDPKKDIGADTFNLLFHQIGGAALMVPRAWILLSAAGAIVQKRLAWDPDSKLPNSAITVTKAAAGTYEVTFSAQYENEKGSLVDFVPGPCVGIPQESSSTIQGSETVGQLCRVFTGDSAGTLTDRAVLILVW